MFHEKTAMFFVVDRRQLSLSHSVENRIFRLMIKPGDRKDKVQ